MPDAGSLNLLGLILREVFLKKGEGISWKKGFSVGIKAGRTSVTILFGKNFVEIKNGISEEVDCRIDGDFSTLLKIAYTGNAVPALLTGRLKIRGNPFALFAFLRVMKKVRGKGDGLS